MAKEQERPGSFVEVTEDGTRYLRRQSSPLKQKLLARRDHVKRELQKRHEEKMARIAHKRHRQLSKGWPADKSPV